MNTHKVFVYGTLKHGHGNYNRYLQNATFIGDAVTEGHFDMLHVGFPVLLENPDGVQVAGELYEVDDETLVRLDRLEGNGRMYDRKLVNVFLCPDAHGKSATVETNIYIGCAHWRDSSCTEAYTAQNPAGHLSWSPERHGAV